MTKADELTFGRYRKHRFCDIPTSYLLWLATSRYRVLPEVGEALRHLANRLHMRGVRRVFVPRVDAEIAALQREAEFLHRAAQEARAKFGEN